jgi:hypothetical protein
VSSRYGPAGSENVKKFTPGFEGGGLRDFRWCY